ncbi:MAG: YbbR-like domain-containing protein [Thermodesulfobacteriota bacterium]
MLELIAKNWSLKLLALAIAVAMWLYVAGQEKSEISVRVPVEITNIPAELLVVDAVVGDVDVRLFGPRSLVRRLAAERLVKPVNLAGLGPGEHVVQVLPEDLKLPPGVTVVRLTPSRFTITLAKRVTREVQVRPVFTNRPADGLEVAEVVFKPEKVAVTGRQEDLGDLDWIWTAPIDLSGRKDNFSLSVRLRLPPGRTVRVNAMEVEAQVRLRPEKGRAPAPAPEGKPQGSG